MLHLALTAALSLTLSCHGIVRPGMRAGVIGMQQTDRAPPPLPAEIAALGCDEAAWAAIKNKRGLIKLIGDEEHLKKRVASMLELLANVPPPTASESPSLEGRKAGNAKAAKKTKMLQRKDGPYELYGELPDGLDETSINEKVNARLAAKEAKDYAAADAIREELAAQNIRIRDDFRTWSYKP